MPIYIILLILFTMVQQAYVPVTEYTQKDLVMTPDFKENIQAARIFLQNRQRKDGSFLYDYLPFSNKQITTGIMVRQAGVFFGMAMAYDGKEQSVKDTILRSMSYFQQNSTTYVMQERNFRILADTHEAYTGTICLYMAGALWLEWKHPGQFPIRTAFHLDLMNTLQYYFNFNSGLPEIINSKETYVEKLGRQAEAYATAQFLVVQTLYHLAFQRPHAHPMLAELIRLYDRKLTPYETLNVSHWLALAWKLQLVWNNPAWTPTVKRLRALHQQQASDRFSEIKLNTRDNLCTFAEGLGYHLRGEQLSGRMQRSDFYEFSNLLRHLNQFQLSASSQRKTTDAKGNTVYIGITDPSMAAGGYAHYIGKDIHTRIDFTRHCLSALLTHQTILEDVFEDQRELDSYLEDQSIAAQVKQVIDRENARIRRMQRVEIKEIMAY